jgi:hypothetical protein
MRKKLIFGIILVLTMFLLIPSTPSLKIQNYKQKENTATDSINEIISVINGKCAVDEIDPMGGIVRDITFTDVYYDGWLHLRILLSIPFHLKYIFTLFPHKINVPLFIGYVHQTPLPGVISVWGFAIGNINWIE